MQHGDDRSLKELVPRDRGGSKKGAGLPVCTLDLAFDGSFEANILQNVVH